MALTVLIMAAGESRRFNGCKLLAELNGKPLLQHAIETALAAELGPVIVVTGAWHQEIRSAQLQGLLSPVPLLEFPGWSAGLGSSIAFGAGQLAKDADGLLVLLADQPAVTHAELGRLNEAFTGHNIVCAYYAGKRGVPAIFPAAYCKALRGLSGDQGAKSLLYKARLNLVEVELPGARHDIDTQPELANAACT